MKTEINPIMAIKAIRIYLKKFAASQGIEEPSITLFWFHKEEDAPIVIENIQINYIQRKACERTLLKMLQTGALTSYEFTHLDDEKVCGIATNLIIFVMAGVEKIAGMAILAKALFYVQVISNEEYTALKSKLNQKELFNILEKF